MSRRDRYAVSEVSIERSDDRRDYGLRPNGRGRGDERYYDEEVIDYRSRGLRPERSREVLVQETEEVRVRERDDVRYRDERPPPEFMREGYGPRAGSMVLVKRVDEGFDFAPPVRERRRSPSPEPERRKETEEIIIRKSSPSPERLPPRRGRDTGREEIIIRERDDRRAASRDDRGREEII